MTDFSEDPGPERGESVVPMINVVFLLLVFFLMTATLAPPAPFRLALPSAEAPQGSDGAETLHMAADGRLAYGAARDEAVFAALAERRAEAGPLRLRADGAVPAGEVAALLERLAALGIARVEIATEAR